MYVIFDFILNGTNTSVIDTQYTNQPTRENLLDLPLYISIYSIHPNESLYLILPVLNSIYLCSKNSDFHQ